MTTHELRITALGPWDTPPKPHLTARCTCGAWNEAWPEEELRALLEPGQTWADVHIERVREGVRVLFAGHLAEVTSAEARRALTRPGADFY